MFGVVRERGKMVVLRLSSNDCDDEASHTNVEWQSIELVILDGSVRILWLFAQTVFEL